MALKEAVSADFHYQSRYVEILGSKIHYIDEGEGSPILFLHDIPTSSYLWRNVIPLVSKSARCIALDFIGMGKSDKPKISYRVFDYIKHLEAFIGALNLKNVTLVLHGWGSIVGFDYAMRHQNNIKGLVFIESYLRSEIELEKASLPMQHIVSSFLNLPDKGQNLITKTNYFIDYILPGCSLRKFSEQEMNYYRAPFLKAEHRQLFWQYFCDLPYFGGAKDVIELIDNYSSKLVKSEIPKLMFYAIPGFTTTVDTIVWARDNLKNLKLVDLGEDLHYLQESKPDQVGEHIAKWVDCKLSGS